MRHALALAAFSGVLLALSFPKFGHAAVGWVALAPLLIALERSGGRHAFRIGYLAGFFSSVGLLYWTALVVDRFGGLGLPAGIAAMLLLCAAVALFPAAFAWIAASWSRAFGRGALLLTPLAWVATELVRVRTFFEFPWCLLGYSQHDNLPFLQVAYLGGIYALSALVAAPSAVIAWAAGEPRASRRRGGLALLATGVLAVFAWGTWRLARPLETAGSLRVALVQPSIPQDVKWDPALLVRHFEKHETMTLLQGDGARLVVWPESSVPWTWDESPPIQRRLRALAASTDQHLLFGNDDREGERAARRIWVGAKLLTPGGEIALRHHKLRLVPFGEYVPLEPLLTLGGTFTARVVDAVGSFTPGTEYRLGPVDGARVAALVCYEAIFPELTRAFAERDANLLVNITNDGWYGRTSAPYQHFAMARVRAVETGLSLVRAANTGISAIVDPRGRVRARTALFEETVLVGEAPLATDRTLYVRTGDAFAWACAGLTLALAALARWRLRRGRAAVARSGSV